MLCRGCFATQLLIRVLNIFNISTLNLLRTKRLETELNGPSKLLVDFQNSCFHGYNPNSHKVLTEEMVTMKVQYSGSYKVGSSTHATFFLSSNNSILMLKSQLNTYFYKSE